MADSNDFTAVARVVERGTGLNELQSRGLVRRLLKEAGLEASEVTAQQLVVIAKTLLPEALQKNGVADPAIIVRLWLECCARLAELSKPSGRMKVTNTVEEVFARMGLRR